MNNPAHVVVSTTASGTASVSVYASVTSPLNEPIISLNPQGIELPQYWNNAGLYPLLTSGSLSQIQPHLFYFTMPVVPHSRTYLFVVVNNNGNLIAPFRPVPVDIVQGSGLLTGLFIADGEGKGSLTNKGIVLVLALVALLAILAVIIIKQLNKE